MSSAFGVNGILPSHILHARWNIILSLSLSSLFLGIERKSILRACAALVPCTFVGENYSTTTSSASSCTGPLSSIGGRNKCVQSVPRYAVTVLRRPLR